MTINNCEVQNRLARDSSYCLHKRPHSWENRGFILFRSKKLIFHQSSVIIFTSIWSGQTVFIQKIDLTAWLNFSTTFGSILLSKFLASTSLRPCMQSIYVIMCLFPMCINMQSACSQYVPDQVLFDKDLWISDFSPKCQPCCSFDIVWGYTMIIIIMYV